MIIVELLNPANYYFNPHAVPLFIVGSLILLSGVFVLNKKGLSAIGITFFLMSLSGSIWLTCTGFGYLSKNELVAFFWFKVDNFGVVFLSSTVYSFITSFLGIHKKRMVTVIAGYTIGLIFGIMIFASSFWLLGVKEFYWGFFPSWGSLTYLFFPFFYTYMLASFVELFVAYRYKPPEVKNQIKYLIGAFAISYTASIDYFATFGIAIYPTGFISMLFYFLIASYAITKHELMDIRIAISRGLAYGIAGTLLIASFVGLNAFKMPMVLTMSANALLALFWAWGAHRLREFIQTPLEEKWITGWYNSDRLINNIAKKLIPVIEKEEVFKVIAEELKSAIKIKNIKIIPGKPENFYADITQTENGLLIPLSSSDGIEGILALGPKISEDPYNEKDITSFRTVAIQAQAILDRIRPYEKIKREFEENQKKLYDAEKELEKTHRLASLGTLAAGVTHEIRNPLGIIRLEAERLPEQPRDIPELEKRSQLIIKHADRIASIIDKMLALSRKKERQMVAIDLNKLIEGVLQLFTISRIRLVKEFKPLPDIQGDPEDIGRVVINLIQNAIEAMPGGGVLTIKTYMEEGKVNLEISDTGTGIPPENISRIFDPFFSTRHEGVGLGLSIVYRIVREHSGDIKVSSEAGKGTSFKISF